jgi:ribonuclease P protein component
VRKVVALSLSNNTIKSQKVFVDVKLAKQFISGRLLSASYLKKDTLEDGNIGIIISKKVSKRAVDRNLIKRRIKHILREMEVPSEFYIVLVVRAAAKTAEFDELKLELTTLLQKIKLFPPS